MSENNTENNTEDNTEIKQDVHFKRFRAVENTTLSGFANGTYRVDGLTEVRISEELKAIKWISVTLSKALSKEQAFKIADDMNADIENINKSQADKILNAS